MRTLILLLSVVWFCTACGNEDDLIPNNQIYTPSLIVSTDALDATLKVIDPRPFTLYIGDPPLTPDYIEVFLSTDGQNYQLYSVIEPEVSSVTIPDLQDGQNYYFQVTAHREGYESVTSRPVMTTVDTKQLLQPFITDITHRSWGLLLSDDQTYISYNGADAGVGGTTLFYENRNSGERFQTALAGSSYVLGWMKNTNQFVYGSDRKVILVNAETQEESLLFTLEDGAYIVQLSFSPENDRFYYMANEESSSGLVTNLREYNLTTGEQSTAVNLGQLGLSGQSTVNLTEDGQFAYFDVFESSMHSIRKYSFET
ncbi:MAG: fibronectin type III domain-containing protein, partial [Bacteroidota bacterium]